MKIASYNINGIKARLPRLLEWLAETRPAVACLQEIITGANAHLHPGGWLLLEHGYDQAQKVRRLLEAAGFTGIASWRDEAGIERVSGGMLC